jgi:hypothetical protein
MNSFLIENQIGILIILSIFVFALAIYLGVLLNKLKHQKRVILEKTKKAKEAAKAREISILESIEIITKGVIQDQCEVSEGCLRIKKLKDLLPYFSDEIDLSVFDQMYAEISNFDTLEARKELSNQDRYDQDKKRFNIENEYSDRIKESSKDLLSFVKEKLNSISK